MFKLDTDAQVQCGARNSNSTRKKLQAAEDQEMTLGAYSGELIPLKKACETYDINNQLVKREVVLSLGWRDANYRAKNLARSSGHCKCMG